MIKMKIFKRLSLIMLFLLIPLFASDITPLETVAVRHDQKTTKVNHFKTLLLENLDDFFPKKIALSQYGGRKDKKEKATGFFRTEKKADGWVLVDPEGYQYFDASINSVGIHRINKKEFFPEFIALYQTPTNWARKTQALLKEKLFFHSLGCWSEWQFFHDAGVKMPYYERWNLMLTYLWNERSKYYKDPFPTWSGRRTIPVFDPEFELYTAERLKALTNYKNDPWLIGHFSDNEMLLWEDKIISRFLEYPENDPNRNAALKFLADKGITLQQVRAEDDADFCELVVKTYYEIVSRYMKKYDPNHLYVGTRFHGRIAAQESVYKGCGPYVDVVSVNYYHAWTPDQKRLNMWANLSGKPVMITEWYAKGDDSGLNNEEGAGFSVSTQEDRGKFYENFTLNLMRNPNVVGSHWFRFQDDRKVSEAENSGKEIAGCNKGVLTYDHKLWAPLADSMSKINKNLYSLIDYMRKAKSPELIDSIEK